MSTRYDTVVVGAGIVGLSVARELLHRRPGEQILVVDQAEGVAAHQTSHNSGVIHAGIYYAPGSLKARLCVDGAARMYAFCERVGVPVRRVGKLIVATAPAELSALDELERRAHANRVPGVRRLDADGIRELEPHVTGLAALHSPATGIVDFGLVARRMAEEIASAGVQLRLSWPVREVTTRSRDIRLDGPDGEAVHAGRAVFCCGLWADRLAVRDGASPDPRIVPFRGGYLRLAPERRALVRGLIYPVPDAGLPFLGVHLTPRMDGEVLLGPSALMVAARDAYRIGHLNPRDAWESLAWPGTWRVARRWWRTGLREMRQAASRAAFAREAARYVPGIEPGDLLPAFGGVRAQAVTRAGGLVDDFVLSRTARATHVRNAPSPAATSALALAELIADELEATTR